MKKTLSLLLALLTLTLLLAGCHGSMKRESFSVPSEFDTSKNYEITFWAKNDSNRTQVAIYEKVIESFHELYPNVTVTMRKYTDYGSIYNDVITNISTGTTPNICITYPDHIATYLTGENVVVPLDDLIDNKKYGLGGSEIRFDAPKKDEIITKYLEECYIGGYCYAMPYMRSTEACYINKTYVEKLGYTIPDKLTWDFIWEVSEAALEKDAEGNYKVNGQKTMIPFIYKSTDNMMIQMIRQKGSGYSNASGDILIFNDTTKELLYTISEHAATRAFSTFKIDSYPGNYLNAGQCLFAIDSTAGSTWIGCDAPLLDIHKSQVVEFETAVCAIPQFDVENPQMISQGPSVCIFNKEDPQEVLASWLFVQYLLTNDTQIAYSETEGYVPVTTKAQESPEYKEYLSLAGIDNDEHYSVKIAATKLLLDNIGNTFVTPVYNGSASLRDAAGELIEKVTKSSRRKETVNDEYIEKLYGDVTALYRLGQLDPGSAASTELGPLPDMSVALLISLGAAWLLIGAYLLTRYIKNKRKRGHKTA